MCKFESKRCSSECYKVVIQVLSDRVADLERALEEKLREQRLERANNIIEQAQRKVQDEKL